MTIICSSLRVYTQRKQTRKAQYHSDITVLTNETDSVLSHTAVMFFPGDSDFIPLIIKSQRENNRWIGYRGSQHPQVRSRKISQNTMRSKVILNQPPVLSKCKRNTGHYRKSMLKFLFPDILSPISRPLLFSSVKRLLGVFVSCFLLLRNPKINIRLKCIRRIREHLDYRRNSQKEGLQSAFKSLRRGANRLTCTEKS